MTKRDWARVAAGWEARADGMRRQTMPVASWMVEAIAPQPGHTVLELAAGVGDTGFLAAELIAPGGTLITSDGVPEMLSAAQRRAAALGLTNVRFRQIDLSQPLDVEAASVDAVLCRWGYMLLEDPEPALRDTRRVLRPGGRLALAAWAGPEHNPWNRVPMRLLVERGVIEAPAADGPGPYAWSQEGVIAEHLQNAGFVEYEIESLAFPVRYPSVEDWWGHLRATGLRTHDARVDDAEMIALLREHAGDWIAGDGSLAIPARTWVAVATG